jgi:hypothetical protein
MDILDEELWSKNTNLENLYQKYSISRFRNKKWPKAKLWTI